MTSSEVNTIAQDCKRDGMQFPSSAGELEAIRKGRKDAQEARRAESAQALTLRAEAAENAAQEATAALAVTSEQVAQLRKQLDVALVKIEEQAEALGTLKAEKAAAETSRDQWKAKAQAKPQATAPLTRWQHFVAFVRGA